ncbi:PhyH-domain-containing protein [Hortaea werneckii]|nr:PhyH-domain-containing protein [Hortaea werneckii]
MPSATVTTTAPAVKQTRSSRYNPNEKQDLEAFKKTVSRQTDAASYPNAVSVANNVPIYDASKFDLSDKNFVDAITDELYDVLSEGPGVYVLEKFYEDDALLNRINEAYNKIIEREAVNGGGGDHFAAKGSNSRIWNSFSKHALEDPDSFYQYFSNPLFKVVCESWLGPAFRMTTQVNIVRPGGKPQTSHRDYHLGFQTKEACAKWPKSMHHTSALLTLQGAVAHSDMPLDSGPTRVLPYSQTFAPGFMAYRDPDFDEHFLKSWVSVPLKKGDAVFFSPALHHAAGENKTKDVHRSNNLIQVSSAFGKPMEIIDTMPLVDKTWDKLQAEYSKKGSFTPEIETFICNLGEGYPFPTNLDRRQPGPDGMAPESEQELLRRGLQDGWSRERIMQEFADMREASKA